MRAWAGKRHFGRFRCPPGDVVVRTNARITLVLVDGPSDGAFSTIDVFLGASCWASEFWGKFGYSFESTLAQWDSFGNV